MDILQFDLEQANRFLKTLDSVAYALDLGFTFQTFDDNKKRKDVSLAKVLNGTLDEHLKRLQTLQQKGAGVFVTINETNLLGRTKDDIVSIRAVWIEDDGDAEGKALPLDPHLICETSPGKRHYIFLVSGMSVEQHQAAQTVLVANFGSDARAKDISRVLRVPGFWHLKGKPHQVNLMHQSEAKPYLVSELFAAFEIDEAAGKEKPKKQEADSLLDNDAICPDITIANCEQYLPDPSTITTYDRWRDIGMILKYQFPDSSEALEVFDRWSQSVYGYVDFDNVQKNWNGFKRTGGKVLTFRTLIDAFNKNQTKLKVKEGSDAYAKADSLLTTCTNHIELTGVVAPKLWRLADGVVSIEKDFQQSLMTRYSELRNGETLTVYEARRAMRSKRTSAGTVPSEVLGFRNARAPAWTDDWVWISEEEVFYNTQTGVSLSTRGFSGHFDSLLPKGEGAPTNAASWVRNNLFVPKVMAKKYIPGQDSLFISEGVECVNLYNESSRCFVPDKIQNKAAVAVFKRHVELVCGGWNREAQLLCNWIATALSRPPVKIRWAPCLIGVQGDGKSLFYDLMAAALGVNHTKLIKGSTIANAAKTSFSDWVFGHCLGFIEEVKWHGRNRYEIINFMKDYITNSVVECHEKTKSTRNIFNFANFFITSNYVDAIPIETRDRRYFVLISHFPFDAIEAEEPSYFDVLAQAIHNHPGDIVRWLYEIPQHSEFHPDRPAPMTEAKRAVILSTTDDVQDVITEILFENDDPLTGPEVICFLPLFERLQSALPGIVKSDQDFKLSAALTKMGYSKLGRTRVMGKQESVWVKKSGMEPPTMLWARNIIELRMLAFENETLGI